MLYQVSTIQKIRLMRKKMMMMIRPDLDPDLGLDPNLYPHLLR